MVKRKARSSVESLLALIDDEPEAEVVSAADVNRAAAGRMFEKIPKAHEELRARFSGGPADSHSLGVRTTARSLSALQEALSAIGAALIGQATKAGKLSASVLAATELNLAPHVRTGSVVFTLSRSDHSTPGDSENTNLLDRSFDELLDLLELLASPGPAAMEASDRLRKLGPRTAKHLFDLGTVLSSEGLGLDLDWRNDQGTSRGAGLSQAGAEYLRVLARDSATRVDEIELEGNLLTASLEDKQKLLLDSGDKVSIDAGRDFHDVLGYLLGAHVRVRLVETLKINLATGKESRTYELRSIEEATSRR